VSTLSEFCQSCDGASLTPPDLDPATILRNLAAATADLSSVDDDKVVIGTTDLLRSAIIGGVGLIPKAGGVLSGVLEFFWKEGAVDIWGLLRGRIETLIHDVFDTGTLDRLQFQLEGLASVANKYASTHDPAYRAERLPPLVSACETRADEFLKSAPRERLLPFMTVFGSIHMMVLREQALLRRQVAGAADDDAVTDAATLTEEIVRFRKAALESYALAIAHRRKQITITSQSHSDRRSFVNTYTDYDWKIWTVRDAHDGWEQQWQEGDTPDRPGDAGAPGKARRAYEDRLARRVAALETALAPFLQLREQWPALDLSAEMLPQPRRLEWSPIVGYARDRAFDSTAGLSWDDSTRISRIALWGFTYPQVYVRYESDGGPAERGTLPPPVDPKRKAYLDQLAASANAAEREAADKLSQLADAMHKLHGDLVLEPGERIVAVCVRRNGGLIAGLQFMTDRGRSVEGGDKEAPGTLVLPPRGAGALAGIRLHSTPGAGLLDAGGASGGICGVELQWDGAERSRASADLFWKLRIDRLPPRPKVLARVTQPVWMEFLDRFGAESNPATAAATQAFILQDAVALRRADGTVDYQSAPAVEVFGWVGTNAGQIHAAAFPRKGWNEFITRFQAAPTPADGADTASYILQGHDAPRTAAGKVDYGSPQASWTWGWVHEHAGMLALAER
jgi:hypothetical protein